MRDEIQLQTSTFLLKRRDFYGNAVEIMKAAGFPSLIVFQILELDEWGWITLDTCRGGGEGTDQPFFISCWYKYRPMGYGVNKDPRATPETYLSITVPETGLSQEEAILAIARIFENTDLAVEDGPIATPPADLADKLHEQIWIEA